MNRGIFAVMPPARVARPRGWELRAIHLAVLAGTVLAAAAAEAAATPTQPGVLATLWKWTPFLAGGFLWNVIISILAMGFGTAAGVLLGVAEMSPSRAIGGPSRLITQILRNAPWLVLLFYCMYLLPYQVRVFGLLIPLPDWMKASVGFALPVTAYVAEIVRGGIQSIPGGQWESADALGLNRYMTLRLIILPQCMRRMLPPWINLYAFVTMATVLANIVGVTEALTATREALTAEARSALLLPMYGYILLWFFAYCYPIARLTAALERRWSVIAN